MLNFYDGTMHIYGILSIFGGTLSTISETIIYVYGTMSIVGGTMGFIYGTMSSIYGTMSISGGTMSNGLKVWNTRDFEQNS